MPFYSNKAPGVYVVEQPGPKIITPVGTSVAAFVGQAPSAGAHLGEAIAVNNWSQFRTEFAPNDDAQSTWLSHAVNGFFQNGGNRCFIVNIPDSEAIAGNDRPRSGLKLLEEIDEIAIVVAPGRTDPGSYEALLTHCELNGDRVCICDAQNVTNTELLKTVGTAAVGDKPKAGDKTGGGNPEDVGAKAAGGARPRNSLGGYGAFYFPWIIVNDALDTKGSLPPVAVSPSGHMAGIWARTDGTRGVHKAPANATVGGALGLKYRVTDAEQGDLNSHGVNCIRYFSNDGILVWGARTLADQSSEWRYLNVRRLCIMIKESIKRSATWAVFEPNDRTLWKTLRSEVTGFLQNVYADGALMGATAEEAFFVKCDEETNPPESIDLGQVVTVIGIAPVKPAEFIIFKIGQNAGGAEAKAL
jgi:phage tail sheath protein FI